MTVEEIAKKLSEHNHLRLCERCEKGTNTTFPFEEYWVRNKEYFIKQAGIYLEVKEFIEPK